MCRRTAAIARGHGIRISRLRAQPRLDLTVDGADEVDPRGDFPAADDVGSQFDTRASAEVLLAHARLCEGVAELLLVLDPEPLPRRSDLLLYIALVDDHGELVRPGEDQLLLEQRLHDDLADLGQ